MNIKEKLKRLIDKEYRKLIKHLKTSEEIDLTNFKFDSWNKIKKHINKNVKSIKVNRFYEIKRDISFFASLTNLEKLDFGSDIHINEEDLIFFSSLGLKELNVGELFIDYSKSRTDMIVLVVREKSLIFYNGMIVNVQNQNIEIEKNKLIIESKDFDLNEINKLIEQMKLEGIEEIEINTSFNKVNSYVIKKHGTLIDNLYINAYDLGEVEKFYNSLIFKGYKIKEVQITKRKCSIEDAIKLMYLCSDEALTKANIHCFGENLYIKAILKDGKVDIDLEVNSLYEVKKICNSLSKNNIKIDNLTLLISHFDNRYDENFDIDYFRFLSKKHNLLIEYNNYKCTFDEYFALYESIKWYRELITSYDLSACEKVLYAYDLMKTIPYNDNGLIGYPGRAPHLVMNSNYIVCTGYCETFCEIINGLDSSLGAVTSSFEKLNHSSLLVRIDDEKYNIHGVFELDPTWDGKVFDKELGLDLYKMFLVPLKEHQSIYGINELPSIIYTLFEVQSNKNNIDEDKVFKMFYDMRILFGCNENFNKIYSYLTIDRPSLTDFKNMLITVRKAQGFSEEEAIKESNRIVEFNQKYIALLNQFKKRSEENKISFFQNEVTNKKGK